MHTAHEPLRLLSFDVDGTAAAPNHMVEGQYKNFLAELQTVPGVEVVFNSGKSVPYLEENASRIGGKYVIACNGAACQVIGGEPFIFGGGSEDLKKLRELLGLDERAEGVQHIRIGGEDHEVAIEEHKHDMVLTIFPEHEHVSHRWQFNGSTNRTRVYEAITTLIKEHGLRLHVLEPHADGALDVVRLHKEKPIDKSTLPQMIREIWKEADDIRIAMFGDGSNDVPAMTAPGVIGVTFPEASEQKVQAPVRAHDGIVTERPAWIKQPDTTFTEGGGLIEGVQKLAERGFFGDVDQSVLALCNRYLS